MSLGRRAHRWSGAASIEEAKSFLADVIAHAATVVYFAKPLNEPSASDEAAAPPR